MITLKENQVNSLCEFIENRLENVECDHSLKNTFDWADKNSIEKDNLIDLLEYHGAYCDCEVILNLPEECDLEITEENQLSDFINPFKIPENHKQEKEKVYTKAIFSDSSHQFNNYTLDNELVIPAPFGEKPKKRIRKSVHYFIGLKSQMPTEVGFTKEIEPISAKDFAKKVRSSNTKSILRFTEKEADYYLSRLEKIDYNKPVGTYFLEKTGIGGKKIELKIHKIIFRK